jgi:transposase
MRKQFSFFVGTDVSKLSLDMCIIADGIALHSSVIANKPRAIASWFKLMSKVHGIDVGNTLFCMEFTGIYNHHLVEYLDGQQASMWIMPGIQLKHGKGLQRGKSDKIDAKNIALYGFTHPHEMRIWKKPRLVVKQLKTLISSRDGLLQTRHQYERRLKESKGLVDKKELVIIKKYCQPILNLLAKQIKAIDSQIKELINEDEKLQQINSYVQSVDGVGCVTAAEIIVTTNEFENYTDAKKLACHCGVVPFKKESGTSIRGKAAVSPKANKKMKRLLHLAALAAIKVKGEFKAYYERKKAEGKHIMSILNAIRNKLVLRIFACVKNKRYYDKNYEYCLVKP